MSEAAAAAEQAEPFEQSPLTRVEWLPASSWILYDLANTIYAAGLTYLFVPFFERTFRYLGPLGVVQTATMVLSGLVVPTIASLCDRTGQTRFFLIVFTLICVGSMFGWAVVPVGVWPPFWSQFGLLAFLALANISYQNALVFYNALLPSVAPREKAGLISGLGVGLGYIGTVLVIVLMLALEAGGFAWQCAIAASVFLVTALPCFLFVRERRHIEREPFSWKVAREQLSAVLQTVVGVRKNRLLLCFFVGNFFLVDVLNTAILYFASFTEAIFTPLEEAGGLSLFGRALEARQFALITGLVLCVMALVFGTTSGWIADRFHALSAMRLSGWCLLGALAGAILSGGEAPLFYLLSLGVAGAFGLAGIWTTSRKVLLLIAPPEDIGQYFGLHGITVKLSVIGSTTFALVADLVTAAREDGAGRVAAVAAGNKAAVAFQLIPLLAGLAFLYGIRKREVDGRAVNGN